MKFIETTNKKDAHTEEWIVIILSVIFAYLINSKSCSSNCEHEYFFNHLLLW